MKVRIEYDCGQYFVTEYRRAACAVLASALWEYTREHCMPPPMPGAPGEDRYYSGFVGREKSPTAMSAGDWLRAHFAQMFGRGIASRWFN